MAVKMSVATTDKFISDILECVGSLKEQFEDERVPLTDDNFFVQKLCSKLEFILQHGLKDRTSILGNKKDYWDYICQCLASRKYIHDGIRYVKLNSDVKTSKGKGRAFLRFCLVHSCLADSLQQCFVHDATRDWYYEWSLPLHRDKWSPFISSLYDLSEITFDLSPDCFDLDITWPTFSRRSHDSRFSWRPPSRSVSISSLNSQIQMEHPLGFAAGSDFPECQEEEDYEQAVDNGQIESDPSQHSQFKNQQLLQKSQDTVDGIQEEAEERCTAEELVKCKSLVAHFEDENAELQKSLSDCRLQLQTLLSEKEQMATVIHESETRIKQLEEMNSHLNADLTTLKADVESGVTEIEKASKTVCDLRVQLSECENKVQQAETERRLFQVWLERMQCQKEDRTSRVMSKDNFGDLEISEIKAKLNCDILNKTEEEMNVLEKSIASMSVLQNKLDDGNLSEEKLKDAQRLIQDLESKVKELGEKIPDVSLVSKLTDLEMSNISLSQELQSVSNNFQCRITSLYSEKDELSRTILKLEERNQHLVLQVQEKNEALSKANKQIGQLEQVRSVLGPLYGQQEMMASELNEKSSDLIFASEKLSSEMKTLASVLFCIARGNYVTWEPKEEEEVLPERSHSEMDSSMDSVSSSVLVPLVCNNARTISKMKDLLKKNERVEMILQTCDVLCRDLIGLAREHKKKLALQNFDLQGTQHVVDTLTKEHKKLQTAEAILKYELKEKKKLLTSLRHQVESTREEWNRNKLKTAQSEIEWHNLREEFAARHKQSSEESGFVDDRRSESATSESITEDQNTDENISDQSEMSSAPPCENASDETVTGDGFQATTTAVPFSSPGSSGKEQNTCTTTTTTSVPRSRLDLLEEQYQLLYSSLVRSSKRSEVLEQRLEALLGNAESYSRSRANRSTPSQEIPEEPASDVPLLSDVAEPDMTSPSEDLSQSSISLENGPDSDNGILDVAVSEESLDSDSSNVLFNGEGLHSYEVQTTGEEENDANGNVDTIPEPMSDVRKRTLENFVTRLKDEKMARNAKEADLRTEIQVLLAEKIELENKILCLQQEKQHVWSKESEFRKRAEFIFRQERDSFESKLSSLSQERIQSANKVEETKAKLAESQDQQRKLEQILKECQRELSEKEACLNSQIEMLKFQMSTEAIKYERALKHYNEQESGIVDMREKMNSQEKIIEDLEESMQEMKEERRLEREEQWHQLEELQVSLSTRDEECSAMNEDLKKTMRELDETRNLYANLQSASNQAEREHCITISRLETVLAQMKTDNESLKREIIKLINDKDALWKRTEALSQRQFSPTRDRWMADSEVTECLGCKSTFSFTLRKHHCRLCGRIFCHNCADHWVMMASSSRRTRICTECYSDHIDKTTAKQVSLPADQEGSEEEPPDTTPEVVPIRAPANSSFDSSSVDSLPASSRRDSSPSVMEALAEVEGHKNSLCDEENPNLDDESFLTKSSKIDFDVISDEEIARSLSACSPYSPAASPVSGADPEVQTTGTRTIQDIVSCGPSGVSGEIWVNAGSSYAIPVILDQEEVILSWEFTSDPKSIAFSVTYKEESSEVSSQEVLLQTNRVQSDLRPAQGHLIAKHPGLYSLVFNNQFSRYMAKKVSYTLKILNLKDGNVQNENST